MPPLQRPRAALITIILSLLLTVPGLVQAYSPNPDLTAAGAIATLNYDSDASPKYSETYNLGPTGLRGWIYIGGGSGADGTVHAERERGMGSSQQHLPASAHGRPDKLRRFGPVDSAHSQR